MAWTPVSTSGGNVNRPGFVSAYSFSPSSSGSGGSSGGGSSSAAARPSTVSSATTPWTPSSTYYSPPISSGGSAGLPTTSGWKPATGSTGWLTTSSGAPMPVSASSLQPTPNVNMGSAAKGGWSPLTGSGGLLTGGGSVPSVPPVSFGGMPINDTSGFTSGGGAFGGTSGRSWDPYTGAENVGQAPSMNFPLAPDVKINAGGVTTAGTMASMKPNFVDIYGNARYVDSSGKIYDPATGRQVSTVQEQASAAPGTSQYMALAAGAAASNPMSAYSFAPTTSMSVGGGGGSVAPAGSVPSTEPFVPYAPAGTIGSYASGLGGGMGMFGGGVGVYGGTEEQRKRRSLAKQAQQAQGLTGARPPKKKAKTAKK